MRPFKDQPLARKALTLGIVPSVCAVTLLAVASMWATYYRAQRNLPIDLEAQAAVLADNLSSAVELNDRASAASRLGALRVRSNIDAVCAYGADRQLFASYYRSDLHCDPVLGEQSAAGSSPMVRDHVILAGDRQIGTVRVVGNLGRYYEWLRAQVAAILIALLLGTIIAFGLTRRLQRVISEPILDLAATADAVSASRDYSLRAVKSTGDEVGGLVQSFNSMLDQIQRQDQRLNVEIAERKHAEELKDAFLAAVSHELRTPLNAILGRVQLLRHLEPTQERLSRALDSLERNAQSQARLVEDLLDVSRIVSGKFQMKFEVVDLRKVLARAMDAVLPQAAAKSVRVTVSSLQIPCLVSGDGDRLQQAVVNLLSNAIKFSEEGPVSLQLSVDDATKEYLISVQDNGIGIAPDFLPKVFERFRQADGSLTRQHGGLGLGLAIVKEVADLHGGNALAVSPGLGKGATFTLRIPQLLEADAVDGRGRLRLLPPATPTPLQGIRVLVVDDEPDSLDIAATALKAAGATVDRASSGLEAIERWQSAGPFDALVCDLAMPEMDGFQVLERILDLERRFARVPVAVALTAYASNDYRARSLASGFQIHMAKPYNTRDLATALADAFQSLSTS